MGDFCISNANSPNSLYSMVGIIVNMSVSFGSLECRVVPVPFAALATLLASIALVVTEK